jgi:hypothetical protein
VPAQARRGLCLLALQPNRVAGGFSPPAPTAPRMRVRTGRVLRICKDHHRRAAFNAGYATHRQGHFTRSGAIRSLRYARLAHCRRFGPSPCPTHYGGRWATMPSADCCPLTPRLAARRAVRVAVGSGGVSIACAPALRPAPVATPARVGFDGDSSPVGLALSSTPIDTRTARGTDLLRICDVNFPCPTAALTLSPAPAGFRHLVPTRPGTEPALRFLSVGSPLCARASSRQLLAGLPLPSASSLSGFGAALPAAAW